MTPGIDRRACRLKQIAKDGSKNDGNMKNTSANIIGHVANITAEQKKQVGNRLSPSWLKLPQSAPQH